MFRRYCYRLKGGLTGLRGYFTVHASCGWQAYRKKKTKKAKKTTGKSLSVCLFVGFFKHFYEHIYRTSFQSLSTFPEAGVTIWVNVTNRGHVQLLRVEWTECKIKALQIPVKTITYYLLRNLVREVKSRCLYCISSPFFQESFEKSLSSPFWSHFDVAGVSFSNLWQAATRRESFKNPLRGRLSNPGRIVWKAITKNTRMSNRLANTNYGLAAG